jgi:hypothetical protein
VPRNGENNEGRLPFSSRDISASPNLGENGMSKLEMPEDDIPEKETDIHLQLPPQQEQSEPQDEKKA